MLFVPNTSQRVVETIRFEGDRFGDPELRLLDPFGDCDSYLGLGNTLITEKGAINAILHVPKLKGFSGLGMPYGDLLCKALAQAHELRDLGLDRTNITPDGLKYLARLKYLWIISLSKTAVDDSGLKHLEGLSALSWLSLGETKVTAAGLKLSWLAVQVESRGLIL